MRGLIVSNSGRKYLEVSDQEINRVLNNWISVKDRMPEDFEEVMFFYCVDGDKAKKDIVCGHQEQGVWHICYLYTSMPLGDKVNVTHWQPLPEYPNV